MSKSPAFQNAAFADLRHTLERLTKDAGAPALPPQRRKALQAEIREVIEDLGKVLDTLDPIRQPSAVFDPSNPKIIGRFIALALVAQPRHPLASIPRSYGSGVYALYYKGSYQAYEAISGTETPIYVGQSAPKNGNARTPREQGTKLFDRLSEHRRSIAAAASTLAVQDFEIRSLVVQSGLETTAENCLIRLFHPIWNNQVRILFGLGKHGDSAATRQNKRSPWDTFHPGRDWAKDSNEDAKSVSDINLMLVKHFAAHPAYADLAAVMKSFIGELSQF